MGAVVDGFNTMAEALGRQREALEDHQNELEAQKTELEQTLGTLENRNAHIDLVRQFGDQMVAEGSSVEMVAVAALRGLGDGADCEVGAVYLREADGDDLVPVATRGILPDEVEALIAPGRGLADRAVAESTPVSVSYGERRRWRSRASRDPIACCTSCISRSATARTRSGPSASDACTTSRSHRPTSSSSPIWPSAPVRVARRRWPRAG